MGKPFPTVLPYAREIYCAKDTRTALEMAGPYLAEKYQTYAKWGQDEVLPGDDTFHQPFGDLPIDCKAMEEKVRQVRICIEVLRSYFEKYEPIETEAIDLETAEQRYRLGAYQALLLQVGASFDELRTARRGSVAEQTELAIGIGGGRLCARPIEHDAGLGCDQRHGYGGRRAEENQGSLAHHHQDIRSIPPSKT